MISRLSCRSWFTIPTILGLWTESAGMNPPENYQRYQVAKGFVGFMRSSIVGMPMADAYGRPFLDSEMITLRKDDILRVCAIEGSDEVRVKILNEYRANFLSKMRIPLRNGYFTCKRTVVDQYERSRKLKRVFEQDGDAILYLNKAPFKFEWFQNVNQSGKPREYANKIWIKPGDVIFTRPASSREGCQLISVQIRRDSRPEGFLSRDYLRSTYGVESDNDGYFLCHCSQVGDLLPHNVLKKLTVPRNHLEEEKHEPQLLQHVSSRNQRVSRSIASAQHPRERNGEVISAPQKPLPPRPNEPPYSSSRFDGSRQPYRRSGHAPYRASRRPRKGHREPSTSWRQI